MIYVDTYFKVLNKQQGILILCCLHIPSTKCIIQGIHSITRYMQYTYNIYIYSNIGMYNYLSYYMLYLSRRLRHFSQTKFKIEIWTIQCRPLVIQL